MRISYSSGVSAFKRILKLIVTIVLFSILVVPLVIKNSDRVQVNVVSVPAITPDDIGEITSPDLYGRDKKGRPYSISARKGIRSPNGIIMLSEVTGELKIGSDGQHYTVIADRGESKEGSSIVHLSGNVRISGSDGTIVTTPEVDINYINSSAEGKGAIRIERDGTILTASMFKILPGGNTYVFTDHVKLVVK